MSKRTAEANKAVLAAWKNEQELVSKGQGTRDWTPEQQKNIMERGKAYDDEGRAFEGQHMKSVEKYPEYQGDPKNIQFLTREEHLEAHQGSWQNPTNWYYDPVEKQFFHFGEYELIPCKVINLTSPIARIENCDIDAVEDAIEQTTEKSSSSTDPPIKNTQQPIKPDTSVHKPILSPAAKQMPKGTKVKSIIAGVGEVAKQLWHNHKDKIIGLGFIAVTWAWETYKASNGNSEDCSYSVPDSVITPSSSTEDCGAFLAAEEKNSHPSDTLNCTDETELLIEKRKPPVEHTVSGHGQHYWKAGKRVWIEKEDYKRGESKTTTE